MLSKRPGGDEGNKHAVDQGSGLVRPEVPVTATGGRSETQGQKAETPDRSELNKTVKAERGASGVQDRWSEGTVTRSPWTDSALRPRGALTEKCAPLFSSRCAVLALSDPMVGLTQGAAKCLESLSPCP